MGHVTKALRLLSVLVLLFGTIVPVNDCWCSALLFSSALVFCIVSYTAASLFSVISTQVVSFSVSVFALVSCLLYFFEFLYNAENPPMLCLTFLMNVAAL